MKSHLFELVILTCVFTCLALSNNDFGIEGQRRRTHNGNRYHNRVVTQNQKDNRIVNGDESIPFRYPYIAGLLGRSGDFPMCGGSLIAPNLVLTAAHCIGPTADYIDINKSYVKRVLLGAHDLFASERDTREVIYVKKVIVHERYFDPAYRGYDIALLELERNSNKQTVPLIDSSKNYNLQSGLELTVAGWGTLSSGGYTSDKLMDVNVNYMTNAACNSPGKYNGMITDSMICAAAPQKDACQGDSGGPLIYNPNNGRNKQNPPDPRDDFLVGIVSWGYGCAEERYPGVYANVQMLNDWIKEEGCKLASNPRTHRDLQYYNQGFQLAVQNDGASERKRAVIVSDADRITMKNNIIDTGTGLDSRIGGRQTVDVTGETQRYPYHVWVFTRWGSKPTCGGSLIASDVVLCAAHCSSNAERVKIGNWDSSNKADGAGAEEFDIVFKEVHPNYRGSDSDIVLFKLSGHSRAQTVKLVSDTTYNRLSSASALSVVRWSRTQSEGLTSLKLQDVAVNYVSSIVCNNTYSSLITPNMLCAVSPEKDSCQGHSGGPLVAKNDFPTDDELVGCGGRECAYCNVHIFKSWIKDVACNQWNTQGGLCSAPDTVTTHNANSRDVNPNHYNGMSNYPKSSDNINENENVNVNRVQGLCGGPITVTPVTLSPISANPTKIPTSRPAKNPTPRPTEIPTPRPTKNPTPRPTKNPTPRPTKNPTPRPTTLAPAPSAPVSSSPAIYAPVTSIPLTSAPVTSAPTLDNNKDNGDFPLTPDGCVPYVKESNSFDDFLRKKFVKKCTNAKCFEGRSGKERDCEWVKRKAGHRCQYHGLKCPKTCYLCEK